METIEMCLFLFVVILMSMWTSSRYDFDSKLLRDMLKLELEMNQLIDKTTLALRKIDEKITSLDQIKDKTNLALRECDEKVTSAFSKLDSLSLKLDQEQDAKLKEMTDLVKDIRKHVEGNITSFEQTRANWANDFKTLLTEFESKADIKWQAIEAQAIKPAVAFLAHTVSDVNPSKNTELTFTVTATNTGGAYDTSTGYFTAPVSGTYWFSVQICPQHREYIHIQIIAENTLIGNSFIRNGDGFSVNAHTCSTTSAVAILNVGDKVFVKTGVGEYTNIHQDVYRWAVFSGALVH